MKIKTWIKYDEAYRPPRCRKLRYETREEYIDLQLREANRADLVLAYEDRSFEGKGKIYRYKGKLWAKAKMPHFAADNNQRLMGIKTPLDWLVYHNRYYTTYFANRWLDKDHDRASVLKRAKADMAKRILVDGELYEKTVKPEYFILTFGLGNNHGGTGMFVEYPARRDCGWHFPATKGAEAVAMANKIAARRGDTNDVGKFAASIICY